MTPEVNTTERDIVALAKKQKFPLLIGDHNDSTNGVWLSELIEYAESLRSQLAEREWRDISTAPKDGTHILLHDTLKNVSIGGCWHIEPTRDDPNVYEPGWSWWVSDEDYVMWDDGSEPTHWQPLPLPPPAAGGEQ